MTNAFRAGDPVVITTSDQGRLPSANNMKRRRAPRVLRWRAVVVGPSVLGTGWWLVKTPGGQTYTVPEQEMARP